MADIFVPESAQETEEKVVEVHYQATEVDEEKFMLMYLMHMSVADVDALDTERRRWILARLIEQKKMEREVMERRAIMPHILQTMKGQ